jgi:ribosomal protein L32
MNRRFAATMELQRPYGGVTDEEELPTLPICPICGHEVQEHTAATSTGVTGTGTVIRSGLLTKRNWRRGMNEKR